MPPMLMTALFALVLNVVAPHSNIALPVTKSLAQAPITVTLKN